MNPDQAARKLWLTKILQQNSGLDFVNRILNPSVFPVLQNEDGSVSTHSMADSDNYVYPTVIRQGDQLKRLKGRDAYRHAMKTGEFIKLDNPSDAAWVARNYKMICDR